MPDGPNPPRRDRLGGGSYGLPRCSPRCGGGAPGPSGRDRAGAVTSSIPRSSAPPTPRAARLYRDADEWAGPCTGGDPVLHIEFRSWADLLIVAPLDANTLAKFALGLSDNFLTCIFRAWDFDRPVVLAPAMNTLMWQSPVTVRHLRQLLADRGDGQEPARLDPRRGRRRLRPPCAPAVLVPPQAKRLACGDIGIGAMAEVVAIGRGRPASHCRRGVNGGMIPATLRRTL